MKKEKGPNRGKVQSGDNYVVNTTASRVDIDGDGVSDLLLSHKVTKNGSLFVDASVAWYGLEDEVLDLFEQVLTEEGVLAEFETNRFGDVAKAWKRLAKFQAGIHKLAEAKSQQLGE